MKRPRLILALFLAAPLGGAAPAAVPAAAARAFAPTRFSVEVVEAART